MGHLYDSYVSLLEGTSIYHAFLGEKPVSPWPEVRLPGLQDVPSGLAALQSTPGALPYKPRAIYPIDIRESWE
jgi:hypothetical protein